MDSFSAASILVIFLGGVVGSGLLLLAVAIRGVPAKPYGTGPGKLERLLRELMGWRGAAALIAGAIALIATQWVVAGIGVALLVLGWRSLGGAASERRAMSRLEGLAVWTESLRDTIAGAVGLEQAIPASLRVAAPTIHGPLENLVDRMSTRVPLPDALRRFADELSDPSADLIIAALIINARLRGPGLRDLLGALASSVREELDMRRKVSAERRSTRRSVQIVVAIAVGLAVGLAVFNHGYVHVYDSPLGQLVLLIVVALYAAGFFWLRKLANFETPERLFGAPAGAGSAAPADMPSGAGSWQGDMAKSGMAHGGMA
jgi:Flp pilus assembly protein TadB